MKVYYKKIKVKRSHIVDHYYGLTAEDFLDEEDILYMDQQHVWRIIEIGKIRRSLRRDGLNGSEYE